MAGPGLEKKGAAAVDGGKIPTAYWETSAAQPARLQSNRDIDNSGQLAGAMGLTTAAPGGGAMVTGEE